MLLKRWMDILSVKGFPGQFHDFSLAQDRYVNFSNVTDLTIPLLLNTLVNPFSPDFNDSFLKIINQDWD